MKRPCLGMPGQRCGVLTSQTRCPDHRRADWRKRNARRDPVATAVYRSKEYREARAIVLSGATRCATCRGHVSEVGVLTAGHVRPIRDDLAAAADVSGLIPQCRSCQEREKWQRKRP